jgi:hypothetical protein
MFDAVRNRVPLALSLALPSVLPCYAPDGPQVGKPGPHSGHLRPRSALRAGASKRRPA